MDELDSPPPPSAKKLSKTPSWITLGFALGALFVWSLPEPKPPASIVPAEPATLVTLERPRHTEIEAVFEAWDEYAVWENDLTEVALWDRERKAYSIKFEVLRSGDRYYYRTISAFTRPILTHGVKADAPLQFTEPESKRREWLQQVRFENLAQP